MTAAYNKSCSPRRAGGIPYVITPSGYIEMLFMMPSDPAYGGPYYQVAKGGIDPGEAPLEAALRECYEEVGLLESNVSARNYLGQFLGDTAIYAFYVNSKHLFVESHFETSETIWLSYDEWCMSTKTRRAQDSIVRSMLLLNT